MSFPFLSALNHSLTVRKASNRQSFSRRSARRRLRLEALENRCVLSQAAACVPVPQAHEVEEAAIAQAVLPTNDSSNAQVVAADVNAAVAAAPVAGTQMHVASIYIQRKDAFGRGYRRLPLEAVVLITDEFGSPVSGATVTGDWTGCFNVKGASATTDSSGRAFVLGKNPACDKTGPCTATFTVTSVSKTGLTYDSTANVETSDSAAVCASASQLAASAIDSAVAAAPVAGTQMHVDAIAIQHKDMLGRGPRPLVEAIVTIKDEFGNPVSGATVTGNFSGCFNLTGASATTNSNGQAVISGRNIRCNKTGPCELTFTVTSVSKTPLTYDPLANLETSDSFDVCSLS